MTGRQMLTARTSSSEIARAIQDFVATYDQSSVEDRAIAARLREQLYSELYRRERDKYQELIDLGGEG